MLVIIEKYKQVTNKVIKTNRSCYILLIKVSWTEIIVQIVLEDILWVVRSALIIKEKLWQNKWIVRKNKVREVWIDGWNGFTS